MARIAMVFPYFRTKSLTEVLFPPLGAASLTAHLRLLAGGTPYCRDNS